MGDPSVRPRGVRVRTGCVSEAEFIAAFQDVVDESSLFAPTDRLKPVGAECAFSLELADGTAMLRGLGLIVQAWSNVDSPFGRPGMKIEIDKLTPTSQVILEKLLDARAAATVHRPRQRPNPSTYQLWALKPAAPPTEEMAAADPNVDEPDAAELPRTVTRELRSVAMPSTDDSETVQSGRYIEPRPEAPRPGTVPGLAIPTPVPRSISAPITPEGVVMRPSSSPVESSFDGSGALAASRPRSWWMNVRVGGVFAAGLLLGLVISLAARSSRGTEPTAVAVATQEHKAERANCPPVVATADESTSAKPIPSAITAVKPSPAAPTATSTAVSTTAAPTTKATAVSTTVAPAAKSTTAATRSPSTTASKTPSTVTKSTANPTVASNRPASKNKKKITVRCTSLDCL